MNTMRKTGIDQTLKSLILVLIVFLACTSVVIMSSGSAIASGATVTVNGATTYQVIDGFGRQRQHRLVAQGCLWEHRHMKPAIDMLINDLGATIVRAVIEEMDWEAPMTTPIPPLQLVIF